MLLDPHASVPVPVLAEGLVFFVVIRTLWFVRCWHRLRFFYLLMYRSAHVGTGTGTPWRALLLWKEHNNFYVAGIGGGFFISRYVPRFGHISTGTGTWWRASFFCCETNLMLCTVLESVALFFKTTPVLVRTLLYRYWYMLNGFLQWFLLPFAKFFCALF